MATLAFWHPFGPHGRETPEKIIDRKREEIVKNKGWTLWSFQHRTEYDIKSWLQAIKNEKPKHIIVLCSVGKYTKDAKAEPKLAQYYQEYDYLSGQFKEYIIPPKIEVRHPWGNHTIASAFKVSQVVFPTSDVISSCSLKWLDVQPLVWKLTCKYLLWKDGNWINSELPTRPEYLLKLDNNKADDNDHQLRPIRALLELKYPYVVQIKR